VSPERPTLRSSAAAGALLGVRSTAVYFSVECTILAVLPGLLNASSGKPAPSTTYLSLLLAAYAVLGAGAGAVLGAGLRAAARRWPIFSHAASPSGLAALTPLALVAAFSASLVRHGAPGVALAGVLSSTLVLFGALGIAAFSSRSSALLGAVANPWTAAVVPLGLAYLLFDGLRHASPAGRAGAALAFAACVLLAALALMKLATGRRSGDVRTVWTRKRVLGATARAGLLAASAIAVAAVLHSAPVEPLPARSREAGSSNRPDVVIVTLDTVRADHLSLYGYERDTTPRLEQLAREATLYTRAIASSDLTLSTHASLFTGMYARHHGARLGRFTGASRLSGRNATLAEILGQEGYRTLAVVGNPTYLAARYGLARGFEHYDDRRPVPFYPDLPPYLLARPLSAALEAIAPLDNSFRAAPYGYRRAAEVNREVEALLERAYAPEDPLFLFVNYMDAHTPYDPPSPFDRRYPGRLAPEQDPPSMDALGAIRKLERELGEAERRHLVSQYDGEIAYVDHHLGRLFELLQELGIYEGSLIIVTSDHGEALGEHGLLGHGVSVYQNQVYVPLLIKFPEQREPAIVDELVSTVDLLPTVLDMLGLPIPAPAEGTSLAPGASRRIRSVLAESYPGVFLHRAHPRFRRVARAVFAGDLKLIATTAGGRELYDLSRDPEERDNLYDADAPPRELEDELARWLASRRAVRPGEKAILDDDARERLRALGYAE
jgi:arylsulfatase A-like enzyme